ncbi:hypothetical protein DFJ77DRAFT_546504 [Powellomyces hirtus]|nr:hypothetical protein DFJ77DRAFT_546504 [Powellomyces hirtus]
MAPKLFFTAALLLVSISTTMVSALPTELVKRDPVYVTNCPAPTEADFAGTWLETSFGHSADVVLKNTAQVYNQLVLPFVHNCFTMEGNVTSALNNFYFQYWLAENTIWSVPDNSSNVFQQADLRDQVCSALEQVQRVVVEVTEAEELTAAGTCRDNPPAAPTTIQIVNYLCNFFPAYLPQDRPYFLPEYDSIVDPEVTYLAEGFGCRGQLVKRMQKREQRIVNSLKRRAARK